MLSKTKILLFLTLIFLPLTVTARNSFYPNSARIVQGEEVDVYVWYEADDPYTGFQTEIFIPEGISFVKQGDNYITLGSDVDSSHKVIANLSGNRLKVACFSTKNAVLPSGTKLFTFRIRADEVVEERNIHLFRSIFSSEGHKDVRFNDAMSSILVIPPEASSIEIDFSASGIEGDNLQLKVGESKDLIVKFTPENARDKTLTWESSDPGIATVSSEGRVEAKKVGNTKITATAASGVKTELNVEVIPTLPESVTMSRAAVELKVSETVKLRATVLPVTTTDKSVKWTTSDATVATVDNNGLVRAISVGTAKITAATFNGKSATSVITVVETPASGIVIDKEALGITGDNLEMRVGDVKTINVKVEPATTTDKAVTFTSSNPEVASVDEDGKVTALSLGETTITITAKSGVSAIIKVTVIETPASGIVIDKEALGITGDNLEMRVGDVKTINVTVEPATTTDKSVTFESSDPKVASVDEDGKVTALSLGETTITITAKSGVSATINVTVVATPAESVKLNKVLAMLKATETVALIATILPETTTDKSVTWLTSDASVATVDDNGLVTAVAVGKATITAATAYRLKASCVITVVETPASEIVIDKEALGITGDNLEMRVGDVKTINVTVEPATTTDKTVTFESSAPEIASVDEDGNVTALSLGETTITIMAKSGVSATIKVIVVATPAESITLNVTKATLKVGETLALTATVGPETATDKSVTWRSSNDSVARVDKNGLVTALSTGKATVTATTANGISASAKITVEKNSGIESVTLGNAGISVRNQQVVISGLDCGLRASLFSVNGMLINSEISAGNDIVFDLAPETPYILNIGEHSLKFYSR